MECLPTSSIMFSSPNCSGSSFNGLFEQDHCFTKLIADEFKKKSGFILKGKIDMVAAQYQYQYLYLLYKPS